MLSLADISLEAIRSLRNTLRAIDKSDGKGSVERMDVNMVTDEAMAGDQAKGKKASGFGYKSKNDKDGKGNKGEQGKGKGDVAPLDPASMNVAPRGSVRRQAEGSKSIVCVGVN